MTCGVYVIEHVESGRLYIGKSVDVKRRIHEHFRPGESKRTGGFLHKAIAKYGRDAFSWWVIEAGLDHEAAAALEGYWIQHLNTRAPFGFNLTDGGEGVRGIVFSEQSLAKMRARRHSAETRERQRAQKLGRKLSKEHRAKLSESTRRVWAHRKAQEAACHG